MEQIAQSMHELLLLSANNRIISACKGISRSDKPYRRLSIHCSCAGILTAGFISMLMATALLSHHKYRRSKFSN
jgi:hypothetical protein